MASLDDILTTQKNGVIGINNIANTLASWFGFAKGTVIPRVAGSVSGATLYTVPSGYTFTLSDLEICNTTATPRTFSIYLVPSGGTASASNALFYSSPIPGYSTVQWTGSQVLNAGSSIQASASDTTVTFMVNGGKA